MAGEWNDAIRKLHGPAPKEKEMTHRRIVGNMPSQESIDTDHLEAIWERAYFAALTGLCSNPKITNEDAAVHAAEITTNTTIMRWPAMTAERDALIKKIVGHA